MAANRMTVERTVFITAVAFAVCHLAGFVLLGQLLGSFGDSDSTFQEYFASSGNQVASLLGATFLMAGSVVLLGFFSQLSARTDHAQRGTLGFGMAAALMGTSLLAAAAASLGAVGGARKFGFGDTGQLMGSAAALPPPSSWLWGPCRSSFPWSCFPSG